MSGARERPPPTNGTVMVRGATWRGRKARAGRPHGASRAAAGQTIPRELRAEIHLDALPPNGPARGEIGPGALQNPPARMREHVTAHRRRGEALNGPPGVVAGRHADPDHPPASPRWSGTQVIPANRLAATRASLGQRLAPCRGTPGARTLSVGLRAVVEK